MSDPMQVEEWDLLFFAFVAYEDEAFADQTPPEEHFAAVAELE